MTYTHLTKFTLDSPRLIKEIIQEFSNNPEFSSIRVERFDSFCFDVSRIDCEVIKALNTSKLRIAYLHILIARSIVLQQENSELWILVFMLTFYPTDCLDLDNYLGSLAEKCHISLP